ncbi:MAG: NAD(+) diphosphatase [Prevotella sp.]|nr:NAD(+) diphosphatase [Prevotella sp.]
MPDGSFTIPCQPQPPIGVKPWTQLLRVAPMADGTPVIAYAIDAPVTNDERYEMCTLRQSYYKLSLPLYLKAGKCAELLDWDHSTRFCGVCGGPMKLHTDISKRCQACGKEVWPQLATAVIVLIHRGPDEIFMARGRSFRGDFYGLIAGFVETGETLEEAVRREVAEETGFTIGQPRYFGSQPWPYPSGLMVGFNADYTGGQLHLQRDELLSGGWFHRDHLPKLPEKLSIARRLIDHWLSNP